MVDEDKLIEMTVDEARTAKWNAGVSDYRRQAKQGFVGNPVVCLHAEGIDALNFTDEIEAQLPVRLVDLADLRYHAKRIEEITRSIHASRAASE